MKTNRFLVSIILLLSVLACSTQAILAQDSGSEDSGDEKKVGFFGDRFAMYFKAGAGSMAMEDIGASIRNDSAFFTSNNISFTDFDYGNAAIGWQLPHDQGRFDLEFTGYKEDSYHLSAQGFWRQLTPLSDLGVDKLPLIQWWGLEVGGGELTAQVFPPSWFEDQSDTNGDGIVDLDELERDATPAASVSHAAETSMRNNVQVIDLTYRRWFGGRRYGGVWSAGFRHMNYEGSMPAAFWISRAAQEFGWTSGGFQNPLVFSQETTGFGPTGSLGFRLRYFRDRLQLFGEAQVAFLVQNMETNSGDFFTLLPNPGSAGATFLSIPAEITVDLDKDVWNVAGELGIRVRLLDGLEFEIAYQIDSYHDVVLLPTLMTIPDVPARIRQEVGGVFRSQDLTYDGVRSSISFQF